MVRFRDDYYYDESGFDPDYDPRTYNEKVYDDNTWRKDKGILVFDGEPFLQWCMDCKRVVQVRDIQGSTVFDRYSYIVCNFCGIGEDKLRNATDEELESYDPATPPDICSSCGVRIGDVPAPQNFKLYKCSDDRWRCYEDFIQYERIEVHAPMTPEEETRRAALDHKGRP